MTTITTDARAQARSDHAQMREHVERYRLRDWAAGMARKSHDVRSDSAEDVREYVKAYVDAYLRCERKARRARRLPDLLRLIERAPRLDWHRAGVTPLAWIYLEHDIHATGAITCGGIDRGDSCDGATDAPHTCWRHSRVSEIAERMIRLRDYRAARRAA